MAREFLFSANSFSRGNFCSLYTSRKTLFILFLSTAFLNLRLLTVTPAFIGTAVSSMMLYKTFTGNADKLLPSLNKCSISLRLLIFSSLLYESFLEIIKDFLQKKTLSIQTGLIIQNTQSIRIYFNLFSSETVSLTRPFLRRLANTLRPLADSMRLRNP